MVALCHTRLLRPATDLHTKRENPQSMSIFDFTHDPVICTALHHLTLSWKMGMICKLNIPSLRNIPTMPDLETAREHSSELLDGVKFIARLVNFAEMLQRTNRIQEHMNRFLRTETETEKG